MSRFLSIRAYAKACGITDTGVHKRAERGELHITRQKRLNGQPDVGIDTEQYPPQPRRTAGRPRKEPNVRN